MMPVNSTPPKPQPGLSRPPAQPNRQPPADDVAAMRAAFARAGGRQEQPAALQPRLPGKGKAQPQPQGGMLRALAMREERQPGVEREPLDHGAQQGIAGSSGGVPPVPVQAAAVPPPTVDPSAFAQLMAQLWSRETQRGAKEVRVQLGGSAWPATGARLVRNAAGVLDIAIEFGPSGEADRRSADALRHHFAEQGLTIGALVFEDA